MNEPAVIEVDKNGSFIYGLCLLVLQSILIYSKADSHYSYSTVLEAPIVPDWHFRLFSLSHLQRLTDPFDKYIVLSFTNATMVLEVKHVPRRLQFCTLLQEAAYFHSRKQSTTLGHAATATATATHSGYHTCRKAL